MALPFSLYIEIDMRVLRFLILKTTSNPRKKHANRHAKISLLFPCGACGQVDIILPSHLRSERSTFRQRFFFSRSYKEIPQFSFLEYSGTDLTRKLFRAYVLLCTAKVSLLSLPWFKHDYLVHTGLHCSTQCMVQLLCFI